MNHPSVLLSFRAENVLSFRGAFELSLGATNLQEEPDPVEIRWREDGRQATVLPVAGIFGANASGKSNVLKALSSMRDAVAYSFGFVRPGGGFQRDAFRLDGYGASTPSKYEVEVVLDGVWHNYGYRADDRCVHEEWAYRRRNGRKETIFRRESGNVRPSRAFHVENHDVKRIVRPDALFLSAAGSTGHSALSRLHAWFLDNLEVIRPGVPIARGQRTVDMLDEESAKRRVTEFLRSADLGILDVRKRNISFSSVAAMPEEEHSGDDIPPGLPEFIEALSVEFLHQGQQGYNAYFAREQESEGTVRWFDLIGPVLTALDSGSVLLFDEIDNSLHPNLVEALLRLFQDPQTNRQSSQLVFTSHDATLMRKDSDRRILRRDQIWFADKTRDGESHLRPLTDHGPRKSEAVDRRYLRGSYGATPVLEQEDFVGAMHRHSLDGASGAF